MRILGWRICDDRVPISRDKEACSSCHISCRLRIWLCNRHFSFWEVAYAVGLLRVSIASLLIHTFLGSKSKSWCLGLCLMNDRIVQSLRHHEEIVVALLIQMSPSEIWQLASVTLLLMMIVVALKDVDLTTTTTHWLLCASITTTVVNFGLWVRDGLRFLFNLRQHLNGWPGEIPFSLLSDSTFGSDHLMKPIAVLCQLLLTIASRLNTRWKCLLISQTGCCIHWIFSRDAKIGKRIKVCWFHYIQARFAFVRFVPLLLCLGE